jgi:hypothetical protein
MTRSEERFVATLLAAQKAIEDGEWTYRKNENRAVRIFSHPDTRLLFHKTLCNLQALLGADHAS